jgi:hypothetical protein
MDLLTYGVLATVCLFVIWRAAAKGSVLAEGMKRPWSS